MSRCWPLQTSLERSLVDRGIALAEATDIEGKLLKEFKRRSHHYLPSVPTEGDVVGWLALMQHFGAPTRLLDWTYSFFVAAFFALADATTYPEYDRSPCFVWALYRNAFHLKGAPTARDAYKAASKKTEDNDVGRADGDSVQDGINAFLREMMQHPTKCVWAINSFRLNERQSAQRGVFLCPGDANASFMDNLRAGDPSPATVVRFEIPTDELSRSRLLAMLYDMNINSATLFPDLGGFARSLRQKLWVPGTLRDRVPEHLEPHTPLAGDGASAVLARGSDDDTPTSLLGADHRSLPEVR
jgi:hypothetical protein